MEVPKPKKVSLVVPPNEVAVGSFFYPTSWTVDVIQPKLHVFRTGKPELVIPHQISAPNALLLLSENGYLSLISRVVFITHGFRNTIETGWLSDMKDAMLDVCDSKHDQLVVIVSWGNGSNLSAIYYLQAAANIQAVGNWLAPFASEIAKIKPEIIQYAVGHSLGAHLIGLAGRKSGAFKRISALDPAGPAFEHGEFYQYCLKRSDASGMVDIMHTDGYHSKLDPSDWLAPVNHYGTLIPLGTIDFYPNFGYSQPGSGEFQIAGSHTRAIDYFIWSISNRSKFQTNTMLNGTPSFECPVKDLISVESKAEMGYYADDSSEARTGLFYVATNKSVPWVGIILSDPNSYCVVT